MKRLKKGFTLIELLVVIAIIGILATTLAPKLREQLAKAKDSKAIALLGVARTTGEVLLVDQMVRDDVTVITGLEIYNELNDKSQAIYTAAPTGTSGGSLSIGGSRASTSGAVTYGGSVTVVVASTTTSDSIGVNLGAASNSSATSHSTEGRAWTAY